MMQFIRGCRSLLGCSLIAMAGCDSGVGLVPAEGVVKWNGRPVAKAELTLLKLDDSGLAAIATTNDEGYFTLSTGDRKGIVPGKYRIVVQKSSVAEMQIPDPLPAGQDLSKYLQANNIQAYSLLPEVYSTLSETPLEVEITDTGVNKLDLQLEGTPPLKPRSKSSQSPLLR